MICGGWFGGRLLPRGPRCPAGTLMTCEPAGGPARAERLQLAAGTRVPLAYLGAGPAAWARSRPAGPCRSRTARRSPCAAASGPGRSAARRGRTGSSGRLAVSLALSASRRASGPSPAARRACSALRLLASRPPPPPGSSAVRRRRTAVRAVGAEDVRLPVVELELGGGADLLARALGVLHVRQADRDLVARRRAGSRARRRRASRCACGSSRSRRRPPAA